MVSEHSTALALLQTHLRNTFICVNHTESDEPDKPDLG